MQSIKKCSLLATAFLFMAGCIVREERPHRPVYVYDEPRPVEVVPVSPGPDYYYEPGVYVWVDGHRSWHHGYWHHR